MPEQPDLTVDDGFDDWIGGATLSKRTVLVYGKPGLYAEYQRLEKERERIEEEAGEEPSLGDGRLEELDERLRAVYEEWVASKSTWTVRALSEDDLRSVRREIKAPKDPGEDADEDAKAAYLEAREDHSAEVDLLIVQRAVEKVDFGDGRVSTGVTVERLRALREKLGTIQIRKLVDAAQKATVEEVDIPFPTSRNASQDDET